MVKENEKKEIIIKKIYEIYCDICQKLITESYWKPYDQVDKCHNCHQLERKAKEDNCNHNLFDTYDNNEFSSIKIRCMDCHKTVNKNMADNSIKEVFAEYQAVLKKLFNDENSNMKDEE